MRREKVILPSLCSCKPKCSLSVPQYIQNTCPASLPNSSTFVLWDSWHLRWRFLYKKCAFNKSPHCILCMLQYLLTSSVIREGAMFSNNLLAAMTLLLIPLLWYCWHSLAIIATTSRSQLNWSLLCISLHRFCSTCLDLKSFLFLEYVIVKSSQYFHNIACPYKLVSNQKCSPSIFF